MNRNILLNQLIHYQKNYPNETETVNTFIELITTHEDCFHRQSLTGHITASAWLVDSMENKILLTYHKKLQKWIQLGGHADGNTNMMEVAITEAKEESGLIHLKPMTNNIFDIDIHQIPARHNEPKHLHYDVRFMLKLTTDQPLTINSAESDDLTWVNIDLLEQYTQEPSILRMRDKWQLLKNKPSYENAKLNPTES